MKKLLSILCCSVILLTVSSCTKQYITPPAPNQNQTITANIASTDWLAYTDGKSYYVPIDVAALDDASAQFDGVVVSISYDGGKTYEQLPEVYNGLSFSYTYNGAGTSSAGNVSIYAQSPDGGTPIKPTDPIMVKIVLVYSN
ncbi:hypothetical protein ACPPVU_05155 [Mucilaginibacter sp. McL0603]|uniref:hypothetical protein n=1 Tax=Mucilaginibacter sp. McL0603 TaxID=3415670 RepID=UPI003CE85C89